MIVFVSLVFRFFVFRVFRMWDVVLYRMSVVEFRGSSVGFRDGACILVGFSRLFFFCRFRFNVRKL